MVPFLALLIFRPSGTALFALTFCRACPNLARNKALKKLFGGLALNFWYGVEEDVYLEATTLGSAMVTIKNLIGMTGTCDSNDWNQCISFIGT